MTSRTQLPVYGKLIRYVRSGSGTLTADIRNQICGFIGSCQHNNGGFKGRSDNPDLYYSLFGFWLSSALGLTDILEKHKNFIRENVKNPPEGITDRMALILIFTGLFPDEKQQPLLPVIKKLIGQRNKINPAYSFFMLMLLLDARQRYKWLLKLMALVWISFRRTSVNIPCSTIASLLLIKVYSNVECKPGQMKLLEYFREGSGFSAFTNMNKGDLLSTAVALFALRESNFDLRVIAPDCLGFIEKNYSTGAFLAGNGDKIADLEYTFYGLLALGSLGREYEK